MAKATKKEFTVTLVCNPDGTVDKDASLISCQDQLDAFLAQEEARGANVSDAVNAVFDKRRGARMNVPYVVGQALYILGAGPDDHGILAKSIHEYITANSQGEKDKTAGTYARPDSLFVVNKGKGGGVTRRCDMKPGASDEE